MKKTWKKTFLGLRSFEFLSSPKEKNEEYQQLCITHMGHTCADCKNYRIALQVMALVK